ncbi:uncharacterized protein LOC131933562 isoform X2 [Physella acuta]|uniref:uncharacterized protein LOC131933562 isoform X2 n=1 Tax=Physella acuta TaxID=109671 RepID=UPI0027DCDDCD|nr:uncharacterized protein LOC131933562 isoform X2 [Physella acuta]
MEFGILTSISTNPQETPLLYAAKSIYEDGQLSVTIFCESNSNTTFKLSWIFRRSSCANEYVEVNSSVADYYLKMPWQKSLPTQRTEYVSGSGTYYCDKHNRITLHSANATHPIEATDAPTEKPIKPTESAGTEAPAPVKADTVKEGSDAKPAARKRRATEEGADKKNSRGGEETCPKSSLLKRGYFFKMAAPCHGNHIFRSVPDACKYFPLSTLTYISTNK